MLRHFCALVAVCIGFAANASAAGIPDFAYDSSTPLAPAYGKQSAPAPGVVARPVTFVSTTGHSVVGEVIASAQKAKGPGILFVHWLGDVGTSNHTEFEADATALAKRGATSLLVDAMWSDPKWFDHMGVNANSDYDESVAQVVDLRRALDLLEAQPNVDTARIAYVGHDFGAMFGALLSGADSRPKVYLLMAGTATLDEWYLLEHKAKDPDTYRAVIAPLDILASLKQSKARAYFFQFAAHDEFIPQARATLLFESAPLPRAAFWYDAKHDLGVPAAFADRQTWLNQQLFDR